MAKASGHWVLARLGKRVLRPGGLQATRFLLNNLQINASDKVVEFAPGLGITARMILERQPATYTGVDRETPVIDRLRRNLPKWVTLVNANAQDSGLPDGSATRVVGEAMLSMHPDATKSTIISEAARVLACDGLYGIHELAIVDEKLSDDARQEMRRSMSHAIHNGVTPLTTSEWRELLLKHGLVVEKITYVQFRLLNPVRLVADEGLPRALKIAFNMLRDGEARKRVLAMRKVFSKYRESLTAIVIVARKAA